MSKRELANKVGAFIWPVMLLGLGVFATVRVSAAVEASDSAAVAADTAALYAEVNLCNSEYDALSVKITSNANATLSRALQTLPTEPGSTEIDPRQVLLSEATRLSSINQEVATVRFGFLVDSLEALAKGSFEDFDCPTIDTRFLDAASQ